MKYLAPHPLQALLYHKDQHRGGDDGCYIHFLSSLGLTNAHKGGIIGVDCEVIEMPANSYTQTTSCSGNIIGTLFSIFIILVVVGIIGLFVYSVKNDLKKPQRAQEKENTDKQHQETNEIYQKLCKLDFTDLSKAEGFIEALLSAEKYSKPENSKESE